ncbi:very short patch repair endonuclease [Amycolatopsis pittospori]|uniref:very short patch repair endonuclease n=1 Tax=Amycolatopsis pittospori TaxID=2749434 RepID=UPI002E2E4B13|nr:very short patch repair endonuclease [Amycolatopsis pittospori]
MLNASAGQGTIRAYLRWRQNGRSVTRSLGPVRHTTRLENLVQAWDLARAQGLVHDEKPPPESWASSPQVRASMKGNRGRDTRPERRVRALLHACGLRYRVSVRPLPELRRTADIVFPKAKVAIFMDGCYWHGCPDHHRPAKTNSQFWREKIAENKKRDADTDRKLMNQGWTVLRFWEHEEPTYAAERIITTLGAYGNQR